MTKVPGFVPNTAAFILALICASLGCRAAAGHRLAKRREARALAQRVLHAGIRLEGMPIWKMP